MSTDGDTTEAERGEATSQVAADDPLEVDEDEIFRQAAELKVAVFNRLNREGRWTKLGLGFVRDDMMKECLRGKKMSKPEAQLWTYSELDRLYPSPEPKLPKPTLADADITEGDNRDAGQSDVAKTSDSDILASRVRVDPELVAADSGTVGDALCHPSPPESRLQGLGDVPDAWLPLPDNASLQVEVAWVQSQRLRVVEERGQATIVHLDRAGTPAPSWSSLGWLETSIRSYAKFVDVAAKATATASDEAASVRRERMALDEIRSLLDEMHRD